LFALDGSMLDSWYSVKTTHEEDTEEFNWTEAYQKNGC
jgi:hypothetical protein